MSDRPEPSPEEPTPGDDADAGADTGRWQAFAEADEPLLPASGGGSPATFRVVTLLIGLAVFAGVVWLLLR